MDSKIGALLLFVTLGAAEKECWSNPCENGATCMDGSYGYYTCFCPSGWHGRNCEIELSTNYRICSSGNVYNYTGEKIGFRTSSGATEDNECFYLIRIHGAETINITFQECSLDGEGDGVYIGWGNEIPANGHFDEELCPGESHHIEVPMHWSFDVSMAWIHVKMNTNISAGYQFTISADGNDCTKKPCYNDGSCDDRLRDFHCDCRFGYHGKQCDDSTFTSVSAMLAYVSAVIVVACLYLLVLLLHRRRRNLSSHQQPSLVIPTDTQRPRDHQPHVGTSQDYPLYVIDYPRHQLPGLIRPCGPRQPHRPSQSTHRSEQGTWRSVDFRNHDQPDLVRPVQEEGQHWSWVQIRKPPRHVRIDEPIPGNCGTRGSSGVYSVHSGATSRSSLALAIFDYCPEQIDDLTFHLIAESMNSDTHVYSLGRFLELPDPEIERYKASNFQRPEVTTLGTQRMLKDWQSKTHQINRWEHLYNALERAHFTEGMNILVKRSQEMIQITSVA